MANPFLRFLKHPWLSTMNFKEKFMHNVSESEIALILATNLFDHLNQDEFSELISHMQVIRFKADELIFAEGSIGDAFYIVAKGSVRVFTRNITKEKIVLARLDEGSYFGEQALIGHADKSRNASIEAITDTKLIKIGAEYIAKVLQKDLFLKEKLINAGKQQLFDNIVKIVDAYDSLQTYMQSHTDDIMTYNKHELIFKKNDKSDYAYIILEGSVDLEIEQDGGIKNIILVKGHIFGELAVMRDFDRKNRAAAREYTRLIRIHKDIFKKYYQENPKVQKLLSILSKIYTLPNRGPVTQILGKINHVYTVTTTYQLSQGRTVIATNAENNFFIMHETQSKGQVYSYKKLADPQIELTVKNNFITGVKCFGTWSDLRYVCSYILDKKPVDEDMLDIFVQTGKFKPIEYDAEMICGCLSIERDQISQLIADGNASLVKIAEKCGACTVCGGCRSKILDLLGQNLWLSAVMTKTTQHNATVESFSIEPRVGVFNAFVPGEHVVIQVKIGPNWIERPYLLSDLGDKGKHRITIKKEQGVFTNWLFTQNQTQFQVYVSQPQGNFRLIQDSSHPVVCFADGIGISPFLTFAKSIQRMQPNRAIHIIYSDNEQNFLFLDEFAQLEKTLPNFKLTTQRKSEFSTKTIAKLIEAYTGADIYICGPEGFETSLMKGLTKLNYRQDKIHVERLTYATPLRST